MYINNYYVKDDDIRFMKFYEKEKYSDRNLYVYKKTGKVYDHRFNVAILNRNWNDIKNDILKLDGSSPHDIIEETLGDLIDASVNYDIVPKDHDYGSGYKNGNHPDFENDKDYFCLNLKTMIVMVDAKFDNVTETMALSRYYHVFTCRDAGDLGLEFKEPCPFRKTERGLIDAEDASKFIKKSKQRKEF